MPVRLRARTPVRTGRGRSAALVLVLGLLAASCVSTTTRPDPADGGIKCPPSEPRPAKSENVDKRGRDDWLLLHSEDGHGQDFEIWCLDQSTPDEELYYFAFAVSHPDRPRTWFGQCVFPDGQNLWYVDAETPEGWQGIRLDNVDPHRPQRYPGFNDIHYRYSWVSDSITITFTQDRRPVKEVEAKSPEDWQEFERMLNRHMRELAQVEIPQGGAPGCTAQPGEAES